MFEIIFCDNRYKIMIFFTFSKWRPTAILKFKNDYFKG